MPLGLFKRNLPLSIAAYAGFRNETRLWLRTRVLRRNRTIWELDRVPAKLMELLRIYSSHEVPNMHVTLRGHGVEARATTNREGFADFDLEIDRTPLPLHSEWDHVRLSVEGADDVEDVEAPVLSPGTDGRLGIISDIDDTVIESGAHRFLNNWRRFLFEMPNDRLAVPGAAELFGRLGSPAGTPPDADPRRPFFYVSSSPWNLYGFIAEFKRLNNIPAGPMLLRDWGFGRKTLGGSSHGAHKRQSIARILQFYPKHRFVMIGDDTQGDAEAFWHIAETYPERVAAIFLRKATGKPMTPNKARALDNLRGAGIPVWAGEAFDAGHAMMEALGFGEESDVAELVDATVSADGA